MGAPVINAAEFAAFVLVFLRVSTLMAMAPVFRGSQIPTQVKAALIMMLTFVIAPKVEYQAAMMPMTWFGFVFLGLGEILVGMTLCFMVRLVLEAAYVAGEYMSFQMGLSMLNTMDPGSAAQTPMVGMLVNMFLTMIFLYANGHMIVVKAMVDSFHLAPPGFMNLWHPNIFGEVVGAMAGLYVLALKIAAPVLGVLFCVKVAFGITAKAVPQMNIMFVGIPVYIIVGLSVMVVSMPWWPQLLGRALVTVDQTLGRLLQYLAPVMQ